MFTYLKAFLIRIREGMPYTAQLRRFLLCHPLLVIELGFRLELDSRAPYGFDIEKTLPCEYWLCQKLRQFDHTLLQALLQATVRALQEEIPGLGETVAFDVKHMYAWVKENNERDYVPERYDKTKRLAGDPDCKLGVKRSTNQNCRMVPLKRKRKCVFRYGTAVLADLTQTFNERDITYFRDLHRRTAIALQRFPTYLVADGAYDAWYVYEAAARQGGIAAVPLNQHSKTPCARLPDGTPRCPIGLPMHPTTQFNHTNGYRAEAASNALCSFPRKLGRPVSMTNS